MDNSSLNKQFAEELEYLKRPHQVGRYWISGILPVINDTYRDYGIDVVISVTPEKYNVTDIHYPIEDMSSENIQTYFDDAYVKVSNMADKSILIHCHEGKSRSVTLLISILLNGMTDLYKDDKYMLKEDWTKMLLKKVRETRTHAQPNPGFMKQLREYEANLKMGISRRK